MGPGKSHCVRCDDWRFPPVHQEHGQWPLHTKGDDDHDDGDDDDDKGDFDDDYKADFFEYTKVNGDNYDDSN